MQPTQWNFQNRATNSYQSSPTVYLTTQHGSFCTRCDRVVHRAIGITNMQVTLFRLSNRFLTIDYKEEYYTKEGLDWVENSTMKKILLRNFPEVAGLSTSMQNIKNAFYVWNKY